MKNETIKSTYAEFIRRKAEGLLKEKYSAKTGSTEKIDTIKLMYELEVHEIELEMQKEELQHAKEKAETNAEKYTNLYDYAPAGYFTLNSDGEICELNFSAAKMLNKERSKLINSNFKIFIASKTRSIFVDFLDEVSDTKTKQSCEVWLAINEKPSAFVHIEGILLENEKKYLLTVIDISKSKQGEIDLKGALNEIVELKQRLEAENIYLKEVLKLEGSFLDIVGSNKSFVKILKLVKQVAKTDTTVLVLGESGTGKELIAKAIHNASDRKNKPLIKVNCSALPAQLIESELFGHEKGAFTSAINRKIGRFELANGGTIFLDEIGDLPIGLQSRLLRVLQESEFERVGGEVTIKVDVRIVTATNRNLKEEILNGNFREDLYYRLNVFPITCPPLRDRVDDIPSLVHHFVNKYNPKVNNKIKTVHQKTIERLMKYKWPGNIRELEHVIERALITNQGDQLRLGSWFVENDTDNVIPDELHTLEVMDRDYIIKVLEKTNWRIRGKNGASEILGLKPTTLESRIKKMDISR